MPEPRDERVVALERFIRDNPDLERLEAIASDFNPFVAMGWTRQEVRHSAFLRWFLDPGETHGLGTYPLRLFLKSLTTSESDPDTGPSIFDVDGWSLNRTTIYAEWEHIDVFMRNDDDRFVVVIENKVDSTEHSNQLGRYAELVAGRFPGHTPCLVYLSPSGDPPSDDRYAALSYSDLVGRIETVVERRGSQLSDEVSDFVAGYTEMVRRHIVEDSEVQALCERLYANHRRALDLIFEHRPDRQKEIRDLIEEIVRREGGVLDRGSKSYVRWTTPILDSGPRVGEGWTDSGRMILCEADLSPDYVALKVILGPGPAEIRGRLHDIITGTEHFNRAHYKMGQKWWSFHAFKLLTRKQMAELDLDEIKTELERKLADFFGELVPVLEKTLGDELARLASEFRDPTAQV